MKIRCSTHILYLGGALFFACANSARANVYASDVRLNQSLAATPAATNHPVSVSYVLNESAMVGVTVQILSGTNVVRTYQRPPSSPGARRGLNTFTWDGTRSNGSVAGEGLYSVRITAATLGYNQWTQLTDDTNAGNQVFEPRGVAVNQNTNSPYCGRVFVCNAPLDNTPDPTHQAGILMLNADGSPAEEGLFSTGGYPWTGTFYSPWKAEVSADDKLYINDWANNGIVVAFDQLVSTNYQTVLRMDNWPKGGNAMLSGPFVTGAGANTQIWMTDIDTNFGPSLGVLRWNVTTDGAIATNDPGTVVVTSTNGSALKIAPYDVAVGRNGFIYTVQRLDQPGDPDNRVFCFPPATATNLPERNATWAVGAGDDSLGNAYGVAVNPDDSLVAVAFRGVEIGGQKTGGGLAIFNATNGLLVTNINPVADDQHTDVAWDHVGNLYDLDTSAQVWRAYSPPGANQAVTVAVPRIYVFTNLNQPVLSAALCTNDSPFQITVLGQAYATYLIQTSTNLMDWTPLATNYDVVPTRCLFVAPTDDQQFFRAILP